MNELRIYVERLFEGKVLTTENIELKEEIYGNLMARFEDLVAEGVPEVEALEQTKASFTSVDDILAGETLESEEAAAATVLPEAEPTREIPRVGAMDASITPTDTVANEGGPTPPGGMAASNLPVQSSDAAAEGATPRKRKVWPIVLAVVVGVVVLMAGIGVYGMTQGLAWISQSGFHLNDGEGRSVNIGPDGVHITDGGNTVDIDPGDDVALKSDQYELVVGPDGMVYSDGEIVDALAEAVVNHAYSDAEPFAETDVSDAREMDLLLASLPLGELADNLDVTRGDGAIEFSYVEVPDGYDGDSVEMALAYNATVMFCVVPDLQEISITMSESDEPMDKDRYTFLREDLETAYGVKLNDDMVNETGWRQLKADNLYKKDFTVSIVDLAESRAM